MQGVYRLDPDGALHLVAADFEQPNGLCLSADETRLFVNDTPREHVRVFDVDAGGALSGGAVWAEVTGEGKGRPDGMKLTTSGHLLCNGPEGVHVFAADACCLGVILTPQMSTNFCFGGAHLGTLFYHRLHLGLPDRDAPDGFSDGARRARLSGAHRPGANFGISESSSRV